MFAENDVLNSVLVHEVAHQIAGIAGMTFKERTKGGNNTDPYLREHQMLTKPAQDTFANALEKISNKMLIKNLHAIEYMPINPSVVPVNETSKEVKKLREQLDSISRALDEGKAFDVNILVGSVITNSPSAVGSPTAGGGALEGSNQNVVAYNPVVFDRPGTKRELYDPRRFVFTDVVHYEKSLRGAGGSQENVPKNGINYALGYLLNGKATFMPVNNSSMSGDIMPVNVHIAAGQSMESGYLIGKDARGMYYQISFNFVKK